MSRAIPPVFRRMVLFVVFLLALPVFAQSGGYAPVQPPQPTDNPAKIEVIDFFYYTCPHCFALSSPLDAWAKKLPEDVAFRRVPVTFGKAALTNLARLYYTLEATGDLAKLDMDVFKALNEQRVNLTVESTLLEWLAKKGVNTQKYSEVSKSFGIETKIRRGDQLAMAYRIQGVPAIVVDGKYLLDPNSPEKLIELTNQLIAKVRAERGGKKK